MDTHGNIKIYKGIPKIFRPHKSDVPFKTCTICNSNLFESPYPYIIEKAIKKYKGFEHHDVIFEYAICHECSMKLEASISEESRSSISQYYARHLNREEDNTSENDKDVQQIMDDRLSKCMIKGTSVHELEEYQIAGFFIGDNLLLRDSPMLISSMVAEELNEVLSKKTKDEFDGFKRHITAPPPEFEELFKRKLVFI